MIEKVAQIHLLLAAAAAAAVRVATVAATLEDPR